MRRLIAAALAALLALAPLYAEAGSLRFRFAGSGGGGTTYTTFNPSDKGANVSLTNGNLTAELTSGAQQQTRSVDTETTGKWRWEVTIDANTGGFGQGNAMGIADGSYSLGTNPMSDSSHSAVWNYVSGDQFVYANGGFTNLGMSATAGDVIGVEVDLDAMTIRFVKNGGSASSTVSIAFLTCPCKALQHLSSNGAPNDKVTANFGASAWATTVGSGYSTGFGAH